MCIYITCFIFTKKEGQKEVYGKAWQSPLGAYLSALFSGWMHALLSECMVTPRI